MTKTKGFRNVSVGVNDIWTIITNNSMQLSKSSYCHWSLTIFSTLAAWPRDTRTSRNLPAFIVSTSWLVYRYSHFQVLSRSSSKTENSYRNRSGEIPSGRFLSNIPIRQANPSFMLWVNAQHPWHPIQCRKSPSNFMVRTEQEVLIRFRGEGWKWSVLICSSDNEIICRNLSFLYAGALSITSNWIKK